MRSLSFSWAFIGCAAALRLGGIGDTGGIGDKNTHEGLVGLGGIGDTGGIGDKNTHEGLVGGVGKRGFRMLGSSCWDNDVWAQDFHLTRAMCAKTRSHRSWSGASEPVLRKLHEGQCITVLALGSSQTWGNCMQCHNKVLPDRERRSWPGQFKKWLDLKFPCGGEGHTVVNLAKPASDAGFWAMQANVWRWIPSHIINHADLIFSDTAVTDVECQLGTNASYLALTMPPQGDKEAISPNIELLIRQLRELPQRPWIIFAELTWQFTKEYASSVGANHWDATMVHLPILKHYDVDQVSLLDVFLNHQNRRADWMRQWFLIDGGHATPFGQQIIAQIMAHALMEESHFMNLPPSEQLPNPPAASSLPDPLWTEQELATLYDDVPPYELIPLDDPYKHVYAHEYMEWSNWDRQFIATSLTGETWPRLNFWVNLTWNETQRFDRGYVNLGLRRLDVQGPVRMFYHVIPDVACGGPDNNTADYRVGLDFDPFWFIKSSLRISRGFWFDLPDTKMACLMLVLEWQGNASSYPDPNAAPWRFLIDDLQVLA